jgi:hypothetical protein
MYSRRCPECKGTGFFPSISSVYVDGWNAFEFCGGCMGGKSYVAYTKTRLVPYLLGE